MRKIHILLILLLLPLAVAATGNDRTDTVGFVHMPLYIVDGKIGVQPSDVPESSEIASVTIFNDEEAIDLYGERAAYGVIVIRFTPYYIINIYEMYFIGGRKTDFSHRQLLRIECLQQRIVLFLQAFLIFSFLNFLDGSDEFLWVYWF